MPSGAQKPASKLEEREPEVSRARRIEQEVLDLLDEPGQIDTLPALLDKIAAELRDAPALSDEAVSRAGIYADHP